MKFLDNSDLWGITEEKYIEMRSEQKHVLFNDVKSSMENLKMFTKEIWTQIMHGFDETVANGAINFGRENCETGYSLRCVYGYTDKYSIELSDRVKTCGEHFLKIYANT